MDIVFRFHFYDHNNDDTTLRSLAFYATNISRSWGEMDWIVGFTAADMEAEYGRHCEAVCARSNVTGYISSEIEGERQDQLMQQWRTAFLNEFTGCVAGNVLDVTAVDGDAKLLQHTKDLYEQQQAQQLRNILSDHVTRHGSLSHHKKI